MKVFLWKSPGKHKGLHFYGITRDDYWRVRQLLDYNLNHFDAPYQDIVKNAGHFYQGDMPGWLFIEFWAKEDGWRPLVELMKKELGLDIIEDREPTAEDVDERKTVE